MVSKIKSNILKLQCLSVRPSVQVLKLIPFRFRSQEMRGLSVQGHWAGARQGQGRGSLFDKQGQGPARAGRAGQGRAGQGRAIIFIIEHIKKTRIFLKKKKENKYIKIEKNEDRQNKNRKNKNINPKKSKNAKTIKKEWKQIKQGKGNIVKKI